MSRYEEVEVLVPAHDLQKLAMAVAADVPETCTCLDDDMAGSGKYKQITRARLLLTPKQKQRMAMGGARKIRMTAAQLRAMRGRGLLMDTAKLGSAIVQNVADSFLPNSELANDVSDILLEAGDVIERAFTGENQYDYENAAKQNNNAIDKAKKYIAAPEEERRKVHAMLRKAAKGSVKKLIPADFAKYDEQMAAMAAQPKQTAKSAKEARFKRLRGDAKSKEAAANIVGVAKQKLAEKVPIAGDVMSFMEDPAKKTKELIPVVGDLLKASDTVKKLTGSEPTPSAKFDEYGTLIGSGTMGDDIADYIAAALKPSGGRMKKSNKSVKALSNQKKR